MTIIRSLVKSNDSKPKRTGQYFYLLHPLFVDSVREL